MQMHTTTADVRRGVYLSRRGRQRLARAGGVLTPRGRDAAGSGGHLEPGRARGCTVVAVGELAHVTSRTSQRLTSSPRRSPRLLVVQSVVGQLA
jgi:hypothetical protein